MMRGVNSESYVLSFQTSAMHKVFKIDTTCIVLDCSFYGCIVEAVSF